MNKALSVIEGQIAKYELLATQETQEQKEYLEVVQQLKNVIKNCNSQNVSGSLAFEELGKLIEKYDEEHSHVGIVTCDTNDVWNWVDEVKKKLNM